MLIITGLSGGGKSSVLDALEDQGFYCVDNLPIALLAHMAEEISSQPKRYPRVAIGIDIRTGSEALEEVSGVLAQPLSGLRFRTLFIEADDSVLLRRFSETRRRHPLQSGIALNQAIDKERQLLKGLQRYADYVIDTSESNIHELRRQVWRLIGVKDEASLESIVVESFAFKRGVPRDVDFVFDARGLANPHWDRSLRPLTGRDQAVVDWLEANEAVSEFYADVLAFLQRWMPSMAEGQRSLLTIAIGCTGGRHRSVYLAERLAAALRDDDTQVVVHHRELERHQPPL
jgi:UPF0042 nucleotide-binding protein